MAKQTAEIVPGEVSQADWDAKYDATTKALKDMGGADNKDADDLPEGETNKFFSGKSQDDLPDGTAAKQFSATEQTKLTGVEAGAEANPADLAELDPTANTKLGGIEESATADQTGAEIRDVVVALGDTERKIVITEPQSGEMKVIDVHRNAAGNLEYDYDDAPEA